MQSRLILHLGMQTYLLPDSVEPSAMVTTLRDMVEVTQQGYGSNPRYKTGKVARLQFEIVDAQDIIAKEDAPQPPMAAINADLADDQPL